VNNELDNFGKHSAILDAHCSRQRLASEHAAFFPTRLALARWNCGAQSRCEEAAPQRAAWFARLARDHQAWLDRGGFAQHEELPALRQPAMWQPPVAAPFVPPLRDLPAIPCDKDVDGDTATYGACN